jgi:hypothetical protein
MVEHICKKLTTDNKVVNRVTSRFSADTDIETVTTVRSIIG